MEKTCPDCKSSDLDVDQSRGDTVCINCGLVLEENTIISDVTIQENADGSTSVVGQYMKYDGSQKPHIAGFQYGMGKESRQITLDNGKKQIRDLADVMQIKKHFIDTAFNFFKLAIGKRLSRGRRIKHIVAACLYLTCRIEATSHMLLDFSDATQENVYALGKVFQLVAKELHIQLPVLDPCLYIDRFSHGLDFGDKTRVVSETAMRLVSRMKCDWIHIGRRPSGLCGAALLVAARLHGFNCDLSDVVKVVKIGHDTIRKRLTEFESTPSSKLTINQFMNIDLEAQHDPPAYISGKIKAKLQQFEVEAGGIINIKNQIGKLSSAIDVQLLKNNSNTERYIPENMSPEELTSSIEFQSASCIATDDDPDLQAAAGFVHSENPQMLAEEILPRRNLTAPIGQSRYLNGPAPTAASLGLNNSESDCLATPARTKKGKEENKNESGELDLAGIDDDEIDKLILSPQESEIKSVIWLRENGEFLKEMEEKREQRRLETEKKEKTKSKIRKTKHVRRCDYYENSRTAGEAIEKLMSRQKLSNKINYEALRKATGNEISLNTVQTKAFDSPSIELHESQIGSRGLKRQSDHEVVASKKKMKAQPCLNADDSNLTIPEPIIQVQNEVVSEVYDEDDVEDVEDDAEDVEDDVEDVEHKPEETDFTFIQLMRHHKGLSRYDEDSDDEYE